MADPLHPDPLRPRVALMIDGDNLSHLHAGSLNNAAAKHGTLTVKRVYGNMATHPGWDAAPGFKSVHSGSGKNASDLLLTVEAMALMLTGQADVLVLASSDGDFSHLAQNLVERGVKVHGLGEAKTTDHFRKSCTSFLQIGEAAKLAQPAKPAAPAKAASDPLLQKVRTVIAAEGDGIAITLLSTRMARNNAVQISLTPWKTWRALLTAHPDLFRCDPKGAAAKVYLKA
jgi:NYN domain